MTAVALVPRSSRWLSCAACSALRRSRCAVCSCSRDNRCTISKRQTRATGGLRCALLVTSHAASLCAGTDLLTQLVDALRGNPQPTAYLVAHVAWHALGKVSGVTAPDDTNERDVGTHVPSARCSATSQSHRCITNAAVVAIVATVCRCTVVPAVEYQRRHKTQRDRCDERYADRPTHRPRSAIVIVACSHERCKCKGEYKASPCRWLQVSCVCASGPYLRARHPRAASRPEGAWGPAPGTGPARGRVSTTIVGPS